MSKGLHWTFRTIPPEFADTSKWRSVDASALDTEQSQRFLCLQDAIQTYLETGKLEEVAAGAGVSPSLLIRQLNRCLTTGNDGELMGWRALIKGKRLGAYVRQKECPNGRTIGRGEFIGSFDAFLRDYPDIKDRLEALILKRKGEVHEARISAKALHKVFIGMCEAAGLTPNQYPFNCKSLARRSLERFMHKVEEQHLEVSTRARHGKVAASRLATGTGYSKHIYSLAPYDLVGLDAHKLHCYGTVKIQGPTGPKRIAIERLWIVPVLESECAAILGYSVGIRTECNAAVIENALISALSIWKPRKLSIPGMEYLPGAGLPSGIIPELAGVGWISLMVDNAAAHFAKAVAERGRRRIGCFLNFGPIGHWEHRAALERLMETLPRATIMALANAIIP